MVHIYCDTITEEIRQVAFSISHKQKTTVVIVTPTKQVEVSYDGTSDEDVG